MLPRQQVGGINTSGHETETHEWLVQHDELLWYVGDLFQRQAGEKKNPIF